MSQKLDYHFRLPNIKLALSRGVMFEICYSCAFRDTTCRRNLFSNATALIRATKGKNIIISSDAYESLHIRAPLDVINMCTFFSMNPTQARDALTINPKLTLIHGCIILKF
jgi:ribonuclease P/MRP protein subunit RPP1